MDRENARGRGDARMTPHIRALRQTTDNVDVVATPVM